MDETKIQNSLFVVSTLRGQMAAKPSQRLKDHQRDSKLNVQGPRQLQMVPQTSRNQRDSLIKMSAVKTSQNKDYILTPDLPADKTPSTADSAVKFDLSAIDRYYKKGPFYAASGPAKKSSANI